ncbi:MAG: cysteine desulfurase family protein, partial [Mycoplasmatales bacterium]
MKYFDYAASTKIDEDVLDAYVHVSREFFPHPDTYGPSIQLRSESKKVILKYLGLEDCDLIYTSGGTEANNLAIIGYAKTFTSMKHFITSFYEHSSIYDCFKELESQGHRVDYVMPNKDGIIDAKDVLNLISKDTVLVTIMSVNNEIGTINDINEISTQVKKKDNKILFMTDHIQGLCKIDISNCKNVDIITISSHKIYGAKGIGCIIKKPLINLEKIIFGGVNENNMRGGTQNLSSEVAFAKAIKNGFENFENNNHKIKEMVNFLYDELEKIKEIKYVVKGKVNIVNIIIDIPMQSESFVKLLLDND